MSHPRWECRPVVYRTQLRDLARVLAPLRAAVAGWNHRQVLTRTGCIGRSPPIRHYLLELALPYRLLSLWFSRSTRTLIVLWRVCDGPTRTSAGTSGGDEGRCKRRKDV